MTEQVISSLPDTEVGEERAWSCSLLQQCSQCKAAVTPSNRLRHYSTRAMLFVLC